MKQTMKTAVFLLAAMGMGYLGGILSQTTHRVAAQEPAATPAVLSAQKLNLLDAAGKVRGSFGTVDGEPHLYLCDATGKVIWQAEPVATVLPATK